MATKKKLAASKKKAATGRKKLDYSYKPPVGQYSVTPLNEGTLKRAFKTSDAAVKYLKSRGKSGDVDKNVNGSMTPIYSVLGDYVRKGLVTSARER